MWDGSMDRGRRWERSHHRGRRSQSCAAGSGHRAACDDEGTARESTKQALECRRPQPRAHRRRAGDPTATPRLLPFSVEPHGEGG
jgi:hypothetical protein